MQFMRWRITMIKLEKIVSQKHFYDEKKNAMTATSNTYRNLSWIWKYLTYLIKGSLIIFFLTHIMCKALCKLIFYTYFFLIYKMK